MPLQVFRTSPSRGYRWRISVHISLASSRYRIFLYVSTSLIAGNREGVSFGHNEFGQGYDVVFPVRSGDRRVFQIVRVASSETTLPHMPETRHRMRQC